jgi:hypothetical protein
MADAVRGQYVLIRIEGATEEDMFNAADMMGVWTPPNVRVYDKRDGTGVFVYGRKYLQQQQRPQQRPTPGPVNRALPPVKPRVVSRNVVPAPTGTGYDDSEDREYHDQTRSGEPPF